VPPNTPGKYLFIESIGKTEYNININSKYYIDDLMRKESRLP
jgi:hypothetical protein